VNIESLPGVGVDPVQAFEIITGRRLRFTELDDCIFTYVMKCESFLKIGRCNHLLRRVKSVQVGSPFEVNLIGFIVGDSERRTHVTLINNGVRRVRGEWFEDTPRAREILWAVGLLEDRT
jgi:hypothetical protein